MLAAIEYKTFYGTKISAVVQEKQRFLQINHTFKVKVMHMLCLRFYTTTWKLL